MHASHKLTPSREELLIFSRKVFFSLNNVPWNGGVRIFSFFRAEKRNFQKINCLRVLRNDFEFFKDVTIYLSSFVRSNRKFQN